MNHCKGDIDRLGMLTSGACAVHCMAVPLLLSLGITGSVGQWGHDFLEMTVVVFSVILVGIAFQKGIKGHGRYLPAFVFAISFVFLFFGFSVEDSSGHVFMAIGGLGLVSGHGINRRLLQSPPYSQQ